MGAGQPPRCSDPRDVREGFVTAQAADGEQFISDRSDAVPAVHSVLLTVPASREWDGHRPGIRLLGHTRPSGRVGCTLASMGENEDDREVTVAKREDEVYRREAALASRLEVAGEILEAADLRDIEADVRDDTSVKRDRDADLAAFLQSQDPDSYGSDSPGRRHAALDRLHAKDDRASAADDRHSLTEGPDATPTGPPEPPPDTYAESP